MDEFLNKKYKLTKSENFDEFMAAIGIGYLLRKVISVVSPTLQLKKDGDVYTLSSITTLRTTNIVFKLGEEFEETKPDGSTVTNVITIEGNKLIQKQKFKDKDISLIKEFSENQLTDIITVDDIVCTRVHTLVDG